MYSSKSMIDPYVKISSFAPVHTSSFEDKLLVLQDLRFSTAVKNYLLLLVQLHHFYRSHSFLKLYSLYSNVYTFICQFSAQKLLKRLLFTFCKATYVLCVASTQISENTRLTVFFFKSYYQQIEANAYYSRVLLT